jgi:hypothetical protein
MATVIVDLVSIRMEEHVLVDCGTFCYGKADAYMSAQKSADLFSCSKSEEHGGVQR